MTSGSTNWNWDAIEPLARAIAVAAPDAILCGGQAVGFWAQRYGLEAVVSRDVDFMGDRADAQQVAKAIGGEISFPGRYDMTLLVAVVQAHWQERRLTVEWLASIPGIETDPDSISEHAELGAGLSLRILHPIALAMAKLHALRHFDPSERHDAHHLGLATRAAGFGALAATGCGNRRASLSRKNAMGTPEILSRGAAEPRSGGVEQ